MTTNEKNIYNNHLAISRKTKNKPFRIRQNFKGFDESKEYVYIKRIERIFAQIPEINQEWYFKAPYIIFPDQDYFPLKYFATQKAIKNYTTYLKIQRNQDPDNPDNIKSIKKAIKHIAKYCICHKIELSEYIKYKEGITYCWLQHLKETNINIYPLFYFKEFISITDNLNNDEKEIFLNDMKDKLHIYKRKFLQSKEAKTLVNKGMTKIKKFIS